MDTAPKNTVEQIDGYIRATFERMGDSELRAMLRALTILTIGVTAEELTGRVKMEQERRRVIAVEKQRVAEAAFEARVASEVKRRLAEAS